MARDDSRPLTFGVFTPPIVRPDSSPAWAFERMLQLTEHLDALGFDEAWFGEHHNGGWELIGAPEVFIAAAAQRTRHIRLATGVTTLPYHHPFLVAERMVMLDHLTRGRVILGVGPGSLAGRHGISLLTIAASSPEGYEALESAWGIAEAEAALHGKAVDRAGWRLVSFYHLADTEAQARADVRHGLTETLQYLDFTTPMARGLTDIHDADRTVDELNASGLMVIGTPDMLAEHLRGFQRQTGGFGGFLGFGTEMASFEATKRSHELLMDRVAPQFDGSSARQQENFAHVARLGDDWKEQVRRAQSAVTTDKEPIT